MFGLNFQQPAALALVLIALPLMAGIWFLNFKARTIARRRYGEERLLSRISRTPSLKREVKVLLVWLAVVLLLTVAAADPVLPAAPAVVSKGTMQVVVVIDVSNSMAQEYYREDMSVPEDEVPPGAFGSSLDMAKQLTTEEIMPAIRGNEIGVVGYAGRGFPQAELTFDFESVTWVLNHWMQIKDVPGIGSDYAAGLRQAVDIFDRSRHDDRERVIVLFSDGGFTGTESDLAEVLSLLEERNIRLVVVALGSPTPMSIPMYDFRDRYVGDFPGNGNVELVSTDAANLQRLASQAGGEYIRLLSGQSLSIDWTSALSSNRSASESSHIYQFPLSLAMLLYAVLLLRGLYRGRSH